MDSASTSSSSPGPSITTRRSWPCSCSPLSRCWWTQPSTGSSALACAGIGPARGRPDATRQERSRPAGAGGLESDDRFVQSFARVHPKEADVTGRSFSLVAALALVPAMARSEAAAEPAAAAAPADQQTPSSGPGSPGSVVVPPKLQERTDFQLTLTTLDALRKKGMMTEDEYNAALRDLISVGQRAASAPTFVVGRFVTTLYGYLEGDVIHDTQRSAL